MIRTSKITWLWLIIFSCSSVYALEYETGFIAKGSVWQTQYYIIDSQKPGPTVMITGGIHGNEPAGSRAAGLVIHWPIRRGILIIVPEVNTPGLQKGTRNMPHLPKEYANLNRNFPKNDNEKGLCRLSSELWELVCNENPDWLIDLHEGYDFTRINKKSVGSSIITSSLTEAKQHARFMLKTLNETIQADNKKFVLKSPPVKGSLARSAADMLGINSMILETTYKHQPISLRIHQHHIMLHTLLTNLHMISCDIETIENSPRLTTTRP